MEVVWLLFSKRVRYCYLSLFLSIAGKVQGNGQCSLYPSRSPCLLFFHVDIVELLYIYFFSSPTWMNIRVAHFDDMISLSNIEINCAISLVFVDSRSHDISSSYASRTLPAVISARTCCCWLWKRWKAVGMSDSKHWGRGSGSSTERTAMWSVLRTCKDRRRSGCEYGGKSWLESSFP